MATRDDTPLRLHWWKAKPNFGDAINPLVVEHLSGRAVSHAKPEEADIFAIGSLLQVVRREFDRPRAGPRPTVWGTGLLRQVNSVRFLRNIDVALVRGPVTAALLRMECDKYGDPGLLIGDVLPHADSRADRIGIVPHHATADDRALHALVRSDPAYVLIDPRDDPAAVCKQIAGCAHVFSSSLHGLITADAYGVANTWLVPEGQGRLKYHDYAGSVGRGDMRAPLRLDEVATAPKPDAPLSYQAGIEACRAALRASFPRHLRRNIAA